MKKIYADFNAETDDGLVRLTLTSQNEIRETGAKVGDLVIFYQDEDDFEVEGLIVRIGGYLYGKMDWDTLKYL